MNDFQFYPTPKSLADRAWAKFQNTEFVRVLEPSAGHGDLAKAAPTKYYSWRRDVPVDCIEIDLDKHPVLREEGFKVVGVDFLKFSAGAHYSHIIMNPPFAQGAAHVLKAWDILWDGEIVAIINAETVRNPFCRDRQRLAALIEKHGEVEFIEGAFSTPEAERQADVDVALVYLRKEADASELADAVLEDLIRDQTRGEDLAEDYQDDQELCLPNSVIENAVLAFNAAVESARKAVLAEARASRYAKRLGDTLSQRRGDAPSDYSTPITADSVRNDLAKRYDNLKDRAWAGILSSTQVLSRTSTKVQQEIESRFEEIKALEFTAENIYGFLLGLAQNQGQIQIDMACEVFDTITRYHSDNTVFYMGWKSNDKHRTAGMRIKTTRFILPGHSDDGFRMSLPWESQRLLADFDRVFAMLDGKMESPIGLVDVFSRHYQRLKHGERLSSSYFDVRYYPGIGTIHFFPRDKKLIDRLNLLVGRHRQWLPPQETRVSKDFWLQYEQAEKFDKAIRSQVTTLFREQAPRRSHHPLHAYGQTGEGGDEARAWLGQAIGLHLEAKGLNVQAMLEPMPEPSVAALEMMPESWPAPVEPIDSSDMDDEEIESTAKGQLDIFDLID